MLALLREERKNQSKRDPLVGPPHPIVSHSHEVNSQPNSLHISFISMHQIMLDQNHMVL